MMLAIFQALGTYPIVSDVLHMSAIIRTSDLGRRLRIKLLISSGPGAPPFFLILDDVFYFGCVDFLYCF